MHQWVLRVRYGDTDQMGFAYYANYLRWFEIGRAEMLRALGSSYHAMEAAGMRLPVLEAACRYHQPARYDDELVIATGVAGIQRASVRFHYHVVRRADGTRLAEGHTLHCYLGDDGRPRRPLAAFADLLARAPRATP